MFKVPAGNPNTPPEPLQILQQERGISGKEVFLICKRLRLEGFGLGLQNFKDMFWQLAVFIV